MASPNTKPKKFKISDIAEEVEEILSAQTYRPNKRPPANGEKIVEAVLEAMREAILRGEEIRVEGFGIFRLFSRKARTITGLHGKSIEIKAGKYVRFKPAHALKVMVNDRTIE